MIGWSRRFVRHARAESRGLSVLIVMALVTVALEALLPWPLKLIVDQVLSGEPLPGSVAFIGRLPGAGTPQALLAWLACAVVVTFLAAQGMKVVQAVLQARVGARLQYALATDVFAKLHEVSLASRHRTRKGDIVRRVATDTTCLPNLITGVLLPLFTSLLLLVVLFAIMWQLEPLMAVVAATVALPMSILMRLLGPRMSVRAYEHQEVEGQVWSVAEQTLTALPVVQAFAREEHEQSRFSGTAERSIRAYLRSLLSQLQFKVGIDGSLALGTAVLMIVGGVQVLDGRLSVGTLIVFMSYLTALYTPLLTFAYLAPTLATAAGSARRVAEVLDDDDVLAEKPAAMPLRKPLSGAGHIRMERVVFGYERGVPVLHGIDMEARPGEIVALVGSSGAGKSTLVSLIPRLFDPWQGRVLIDGQDVREAALASVRRSTALVLQDTFLLPVSVAENIAYGRPGATRLEVEAAARAANAHEFILSLPGDYDSVVGERGITLSAGQRQRIAIARALLQDAPVLVMDEPTSALDAATERDVLDAVKRLMQGRTCIIIAHRLSTVRHAHRIVVLDRGRVAEVGTHRDLLRSGALYRKLNLALFPDGVSLQASVSG
jgi:ATP-binding cassette subfamily B protein/subfamily B ATP-binding cassette protein MsbA